MVARDCFFGRTMQIADIISMAPSSTPGQTRRLDADEAAFLRHLDDFQVPGLEVDREPPGWPSSPDDQGKTQSAVREPQGADPNPIVDPVGADEPAVEPTDEGAQPGDKVDAPETQNTQEAEAGAQDGPAADDENADPGDDTDPAGYSAARHRRRRNRRNRQCNKPVPD